MLFIGLDAFWTSHERANDRTARLGYGNRKPS